MCGILSTYLKHAGCSNPLVGMNESRFTSGIVWVQCKPDQDEFTESGYGTSAVALMSVVVSYGHVQR